MHPYPKFIVPTRAPAGSATCVVNAASLTVSRRIVPPTPSVPFSALTPPEPLTTAGFLLSPEFYLVQNLTFLGSHSVRPFRPAPSVRCIQVPP